MVYSLATFVPSPIFRRKKGHCERNKSTFYAMRVSSPPTTSIAVCKTLAPLPLAHCLHETNKMFQHSYQASPFIPSNQQPPTVLSPRPLIVIQPPFPPSLTNVESVSVPSLTPLSSPSPPRCGRAAPSLFPFCGRAFPLSLSHLPVSFSVALLSAFPSQLLPLTHSSSCLLFNSSPFRPSFARIQSFIAFFLLPIHSPALLFSVHAFLPLTLSVQRLFFTAVSTLHFHERLFLLRPSSLVLRIIFLLF